MPPTRVSRFITILVPLLALTSLACFAYPLYVIWPFRHQRAGELSVALFIARIGPWLSIVCAVLCLALVIYFWRRINGRIRRVAAVLFIVLAALGSVLARFNLYEQMFHPIRRPQFEPADRARIDGDDMVLALRVNGARRAYPIREIAYHHIVNDTLAGVPVVATY